MFLPQLLQLIFRRHDLRRLRAAHYRPHFLSQCRPTTTNKRVGCNASPEKSQKRAIALDKHLRERRMVKVETISPLSSRENNKKQAELSAPYGTVVKSSASKNDRVNLREQRCTFRRTREDPGQFSEEVVTMNM